MNNAGRIQRGVAWLAAHVTSALPLTLVSSLACLVGSAWADNSGASAALIWIPAMIGTGTILSAISFVGYLVIVRSDLLVPRVRVTARVRPIRHDRETPPRNATQGGTCGNDH